MVEFIASMVVWILLVLSVFQLSWNEPLRYRFISKDQIRQEERALFPNAPKFHPLPSALEASGPLEQAKKMRRKK